MGSHGLGYALRRSGLLNVEAGEYGEIASGTNRDLRGTWCSASCAIGKPSGRQIVHVSGEYKNACPNCHSDNLFHDRISPIRAPKMQEDCKQFMESEAKRKANK